MKTLTSEQIVRSNKRTDMIVASIGLFILFIAISLLLSVFIDLISTGYPRLFDASFYTNSSSSRPARAGILAAFVGTSYVMLVTAAIAIPFGVGAGLYLEEYAPKNWFTNLIEINVSNLAGVPSIIYGLLGLGLFIYGFGMRQVILTSGMVLALLILPVIIVSTREAVRSIPQELREAAYGLGADKWQTVRMYIIPAARPGILTGTIVGLARAIGEAAPVIVIGAVTFITFLPPSPIGGEFPFINFDWLFNEYTLMPIQLYDWGGRPQAAFHVNAAAAGVILLLMTVAMNGIAIYIRYRLRRNMK